MGRMSFRSTSRQLLRDLMIPFLCLQPPRPGVHLGPPIHQQHLGSCFPVIPPAQPCSPVPPAPPWPVVDHPTAQDSNPSTTPCKSALIALSGSFPLLTPSSSIALALLWSSGFRCCHPHSPSARNHPGLLHWLRPPQLFPWCCLNIYYGYSVAGL